MSKEDEKKIVNKIFLSTLMNAIDTASHEGMSEVDITHTLVSFSVGLLSRYAKNMNAEIEIDDSAANMSNASFALMGFVLSGMTEENGEGFRDLVDAGKKLVDAAKENNLDMSH